MSGGNKTTFPVLSIVDPDSCCPSPPSSPPSRGFDALFHSTESYINKNENLMRDMLALKAIGVRGPEPGCRLRQRPGQEGPGTGGLGSSSPAW